MTLPNRAQQIAAVVKFLDSDRQEDRTLEDIAKEIVDGYHDFIMSGIRKPATPLREGMLFKSAPDGKTRRVAWLDEASGRFWAVSETDSYGWLGSLDSPFFDYAEEFTSKTYKVIDGKRKLVEMTDEEVKAAWETDEWKVGDRLSIGQRQGFYEVVALGPRSVLLRDECNYLHSDSTSSLERFYRREPKMGDIKW